MNHLTTVGLAAAIGTPLMLGAEEDVIATSWSESTKIEGGKNAVEVKLSAKITAAGFYHQVDDEWSDDAVYRSISALNALVLPIPPNPTAAEFNSYINTASATWYNSQRAFADGILINDAELGLAVKAYGHFTAGIKFEGAKTDEDAEIDNWYLGLYGLPILGQVTLRDADIQQSPLNKDLFMRENSIAHECFELDDLIALHVENFKLFVHGDPKSKDQPFGLFGYWLAVGIAAAEPGAADRNWQGQGGLRYTAMLAPASNTQFLVGVDAELRNRSPTNHTAYSDNLTFNVGLDYGPTLVAMTGNAEEALLIHPSAAFTTGPFAIGATVNWGDITAADNPSPMDTVMNAYLVALYNGAALPAFVNTVTYSDWTVMGATVEAAVSLTGEKQELGGGIKKPTQRFDMKTGGVGAFEAVGRFSLVQIQDEASQQDRVLTPGVAVAADFVNAALYTAANREEGGEATQITLGVNWYPCAALRCGLFVNTVDWSYDDGVIVNNAARNTGVVAPVNAITLPNLLVYQATSGIRNDYSVSSVFLASQARF
jgi:hypothetical protein